MQRSAPQRSSAILLLLATLLLSGPRLLAQGTHSSSPNTPAPIRVHGDTIYLPGLSVQLTPQGFPQQLQVIGQPDAPGHIPDTTSLLAENIHFHFTRRSDAKDIRLTAGGLHFTVRQPDTVGWQATATSDELRIDVQGSLTSGGSLSFSVNVTALQDLDLKDITFHIPFSKEASGLMAGLGVSGARPDSILVWDWSTSRNHIAKAWIGNGHAGLQFELSSSPGEQGKGGIAVGIKGKSMLVNDHTGTMELKKGDILVYHFEGMITREPPNDVHLSNN